MFQRVTLLFLLLPTLICAQSKDSTNRPVIFEARAGLCSFFKAKNPDNMKDQLTSAFSSNYSLTVGKHGRFFGFTTGIQFNQFRLEGNEKIIGDVYSRSGNIVSNYTTTVRQTLMFHETELLIAPYFRIPAHHFAAEIGMHLNYVILDKKGKIINHYTDANSNKRSEMIHGDILYAYDNEQLSFFNQITSGLQCQLIYKITPSLCVFYHIQTHIRFNFLEAEDVPYPRNWHSISNKPIPNQNIYQIELMTWYANSIGIRYNLY